ncbi:MAG: iron ABC transporter permease, partial [Myxococcales bacterium]|nr:iron ABC transporter permease [Myxococcales bacterium]
MTAPKATLSYGLGLLLGAFFGVPLALLLWQAGGTTGGEGPTWWALWTSPESTVALWGTVVTSAGAAAVAFVLAVPLALLIGRTALPMRGVLRALFTLPAALPPFILGMGWVSLGNPRAGLLNLWLGPGTVDIYGQAGIAFVLGSAGLPMVLLPTLAALSRIDASLEEAA